MKVTGAGPGLPSADAAAGGIDATSGSAAAAGNEQVGGVGAGEASGVSGTTHTDAAHATSESGRAAEMRHLVADLGADVTAGRLSPEAAVETLVSRVLDQRAGGVTPNPAVRAQLEAALRATLAEDPFVGAQLAALTRSRG